MFSGIAAATAIIVWTLVPVLREPDEPVSRDKALYGFLAMVALWAFSFSLAWVTLVAR